MASPCSDRPLVGGISIGDGMNSMTASSSACTPLFLNAVPHMHSTMSFLSARALRPRLISSSLSAPPPRYLSVSASSPSAAASIILARYSSASALQLGRDLAVLELHALGFHVPVDSLHLDEVDDALEGIFGADGQLDGHGIGAQARADHVADAQEVRAGAVHLVDEGDARHVVAVHLPPHRLRLRLHAGDRIEQRYGASRARAGNARLRW